MSLEESSTQEEENPSDDWRRSGHGSVRYGVSLSIELRHRIHTAIYYRRDHLYRRPEMKT